MLNQYPQDFETSGWRTTVEGNIGGPEAPGSPGPLGADAQSPGTRGTRTAALTLVHANSIPPLNLFDLYQRVRLVWPKLDYFV